MLNNDLNNLKDDISEITRNIWINPIYNNNGITITQNNDGSVHVNGTTTSAIYADYYLPEDISLTQYMLSIKRKGSATGTIAAAIRNAENTNPIFSWLSPDQVLNSVSITTFSVHRFEIYLPVNTTYDCDLYIQLESGTEVTEYIPRISAKDVIARNRIVKLEENITDLNIMHLMATNYKTVITVNEKSILKRWGSSNGIITNNGTSVEYLISTNESGGFQTETFMASDLPSIDIRICLDAVLESGHCRVWLGGSLKTNGTTSFLAQKDITINGHYEIDVDLAYVDVYTSLDVSKPLFVMVTVLNNSGGAHFTIENLIVKSNILTSPYINNYEKIKFNNILERIRIEKSESITNDTKYYFSPNGTKYLLTVDDNEAIKLIKAIPNKSVFIGNSLLMGWSTFGMAASDNQHDYYQYITNKIAELKPDATYNRISNGGLEHSTNNTDFTSAWNTIKSYLTADVELICIQLGDNVNNEAKVMQFEGTSFYTMVDYIHTNCPNARLVWVGTWYQSIHDWLVTACWEKGVEFIDILDLSIYTNKASYGDIITRTEDREQTLSGIFIESEGKLLINITIYNKQYNLTIPSYTSVVDNENGTFTMVAPYTVVDSSGVASHPNNAGMLAIANRICKSLDFIYNEGDIG